MERRNFLKALGAGAVGTLLATQLGDQAFAPAQAVSLDDQQAASYFIFPDQNDGNKIKARNCITGVIDHAGTDAGTVIQGAIDALATAGGLIAMSQGTYNIGSSLTWTAAKTLILRGMGANSTSLNWTGSTGSILNFDPGKFITNHQIVLEDFGLTTQNCANITAVNLNHVALAHLERVWITSPNGGANSFGFYSNEQGNNSMAMIDCRSNNFEVNYKIFTDHVLMARCQATYGLKGFWFATAGAEIVGLDLHAYHQRKDPVAVGFDLDYSSGYMAQATLISPYSENPPDNAPTDYRIEVGNGHANVVVVCPDAFRNPPVMSIGGSTSNYQILGKDYQTLATKITESFAVSIPPPLLLNVSRRL